MLIDREALCGLIPHAGRMCLLSGVLDWSEDSILCTAISHRESDNPLRAEGRLASVHLLEYGAQAMAVHGRLLADDPSGIPVAGYLAALQDVELHQEFLDDVIEPLEIRAHKLAASDQCLMYRFTVAAAERVLVSARATIVLRGMTQ